MAFDGIFKSLFAMMGITPEEAGNMAKNVQEGVQSVDARLTNIELSQARIEAHIFGKELEHGDDNGN